MPTASRQAPLAPTPHQRVEAKRMSRQQEGDDMLFTTEDPRWSEFTKLLFARLGYSVPGNCDNTLAILP